MMGLSTYAVQSHKLSSSYDGNAKMKILAMRIRSRLHEPKPARLLICTIYTLSFISVLASHAETPPLESFMEIPAHIRRQELFKVTVKL